MKDFVRVRGKPRVSVKPETFFPNAMFFCYF